MSLIPSCVQITRLLADWGRGNQHTLAPPVFIGLCRSGRRRVRRSRSSLIPQTSDRVLNKLAVLHTQRDCPVELRFFGGLSVEEMALVMGISPTTVKREWGTARALLRHELKREGKP